MNGVGKGVVEVVVVVVDGVVEDVVEEKVVVLVEAVGKRVVAAAVVVSLKIRWVVEAVALAVVLNKLATDVTGLIVEEVRGILVDVDTAFSRMLSVPEITYCTTSSCTPCP